MRMALPSVRSAYLKSSNVAISFRLSDMLTVTALSAKVILLLLRTPDPTLATA